MRILVVNSGSATIKYEVLNMPACQVLVWGLVDGIGAPVGYIKHRSEGRNQDDQAVVKDHRQALEIISKELFDGNRVGAELFGIGHRVVHGGVRFCEPVLIDQDVIEGIKSVSPLAPLHNQANLMGIKVLREICPSVPQVAVFDTAFHQSLPPVAYQYALPRDVCRSNSIRRFGFHGISHSYVARRAAVMLARPGGTADLITLHLGNGASAAAIRDGRSVDTSMGLTPLEGLVMGTRSGDIDPAIVFHLARAGGHSIDDLETILYEESGLKGLTGTNDMREILRRADAGEADANLAIQIYTYRIKKYIGAYAAVLGRLDAVVFTGGIGENSALIRRRCVEGLAFLGMEIDERENSRESGEERDIGLEGRPARVLVIPTNEEREIASQSLSCIQAARRKP